MDVLIERLLYFSRVENGQIAYNMKNISVKKLIAQYIKGQEFNFKKKGIEIKSNISTNEIIEFFIKNPDRKISQDEFKQRIWTNEQKSDNILPMYITYLQEKFIALDANIQINDIDGYKLEKLIL